jgi:formylglycine-generating enzyme
MQSHMVQIPGESFHMGSSDFYPEVGPVREVHVDEFTMDRTPLTVAEFERFITDTGHEDQIVDCSHTNSGSS